MSTKKILFTSHTANFQKFNRPFMRMLKGSLDEQYSDFNIGGWDVDYASANEEKILDADNVFAVDFPRNPFRIPQLIRSYKQVKKIIESTHYDLIHTHTPVGSVVTRLAARKARKNGTKVLYTAHGFHFYKGAPIMNWLIYYPIEKAMSHMTDCLITINDEDYAFAKKHLKAARVELVNGVGYNSDLFFKLDDEKRLALRQKNGYSPDEKLLIYVAEMNKNKNQSMLLDMMKELKDSYNVRLLIAGADNFDGRYISYSRQLGVDGKVDFLGHREDVCELVGMSDICVASSLREGLPVNIMEAMACGLPVVAADNRGHRALIKDGRDGFLVPANDSHMMARKVSALLDDDGLFSQISSNAAEDVKKFSKENVGRQMISIYKDYQR